MKEGLIEKEAIPPSLNSVFSPESISMDLTSCGLLVDRAEKISRLYAKHLDWNKTKEIWHDSRLGGRGSRHSSQKIFRILKSRFQSAGSELPVIEKLPTIFDLCESHRSKAQILYFYLLETDMLVKYVVHEFIRNMFLAGDDKLNFKSELDKILERFRFSNGNPLQYSKSTMNRWGRGFRSVMRKIGVLDSSQSVIGSSPPISDLPLLVSTGYSWRKKGDTWLASPVGWMYLFQPTKKWNPLVKRLSKFDSWCLSEFPGEVQLTPLNDHPFKVNKWG